MSRNKFSYLNCHKQAVIVETDLKDGQRVTIKVSGYECEIISVYALNHDPINVMSGGVYFDAVIKRGKYPNDVGRICRSIPERNVNKS
jgi:hypothetical protein